MSLAEFIQNNLWGLIIAAISIAFQIGVRYAQLKNFVTKEYLLKDYTKDEVDKKITTAFENHCPFPNLNERVEELEKNHYKFHNEYQRSNSEVMMVLQEIKLNTKRICDKIEVKYLENKN